MSTYTPERVRALVDDLDAIFRAAAQQKTLKEAFETEVARLVSLFF
jgi:hypothetical protein